MRGFIRKWAVPVGCGLFALLIFRFVLFVGYVPTGSMEPSIMAGSVVLGTRIMGGLRTGDVIVFRHDGALLVKRVAGIPGDQVHLSGSTLEVPDRHYYVLGDNECASIDSRCWSDPFVNREDVVAVVFAR